MKQAMINYIQSVKNDELYTPCEAIYPLLKYLPKNKIIWECTDFGSSKITEILKKNDYKVITSHINQNQDFFNYEPKEKYDIIITNPPYSLKNQFLKRAYELNKPFAFLLPLTTLEGVERGELFKNNGIDVLILNRRINFMKNKKSNWFNTSWFCYKILKEKLIFEEVKK